MLEGVVEADVELLDGVVEVVVELLDGVVEVDVELLDGVVEVDVELLSMLSHVMNKSEKQNSNSIIWYKSKKANFEIASVIFTLTFYVMQSSQNLVEKL